MRFCSCGAPVCWSSMLLAGSQGAWPAVLLFRRTRPSPWEKFEFPRRGPLARRKESWAAIVPRRHPRKRGPTWSEEATLPVMDYCTHPFSCLESEALDLSPADGGITKIFDCTRMSTTTPKKLEVCGRSESCRNPRHGGPSKMLRGGAVWQRKTFALKKSTCPLWPPQPSWVRVGWRFTDVTDLKSGTRLSTITRNDSNRRPSLARTVGEVAAVGKRVDPPGDRHDALSPRFSRVRCYALSGGQENLATTVVHNGAYCDYMRTSPAAIVVEIC